ncbi:MAG: PAS domain-containing protein [Thioploca sp.]|nr:PAS domain-containing protein [Thioploca sp.]
MPINNKVMLERTDLTAPLVPDETDTLVPAWKPLYLFNIYRLTIATILIISFIAEVSPSFLGQFDERLFLVVGWFYSVLAFASFFTIQRRWPSFHIQILGQGLLDILAITLLMHASGGVYSGLGMLLIVSIAGGSLLTEGRTAFFFAAVASLGVLIQVTLVSLLYYGLSYTVYTHAGILGISFFTTAFLAHILAKRAKTSEALAKQRGLHLQYLAQLNAQIVQNIQSGIVVIDKIGRIHLFNSAAQQLLGISKPPTGYTLKSIAPQLAEQVRNWQKSSQTTSSVFRPDTGEVDLLASFIKLTRGRSANLLIMLEDATLTTQRAQQLKLASLGRLTASIAHEVRNPLSAISHAGQLLAESPLISPADLRLTQIIANNSRRVNFIIENILQLSRRGPPNSQRFALLAWLQTFIEDLINQQGLAPTDILLHTKGTAFEISFDPIHLYQVLANLCENGLRYSQGNPLLELTMGYSEESQRPYLDICDHGPGMTAEVKAQVFEPFFTTHSTGTGLGLYLAREICEANQASLHLLTHSSTGCCFRIIFPTSQ